MACVDVSLLNSLRQTGGKRGTSRQQKALAKRVGEETAAILEAHSAEMLRLLPNIQGYKVWLKPHRTMPHLATLWGVLGYKEHSEKLQRVLLGRKQRQEQEEKEAQEKIKEQKAKRAAATDARVAKLEAWLQQCAAQDPAFPFPDCTAFKRFLAHQEDGRSYPHTVNKFKSQFEAGANEVVLDFFMSNSQTPKVSFAKLKHRVALLNQIVGLADGDSKVLSSSAVAKRRLFLRAQDLDSEAQGAAGKIVEELNLNDNRVASLDVWLKTEAQLSFFKDAASVRAWMDDFGQDSAKRWSVLDWDGNEIVSDFFMNLAKVRITGPQAKWNIPGKMTLTTVKTHLQKLQQVLELCHDMPPVAKLRLCSDFKRQVAKAPADIVSDVDLKNNRQQMLDQWLKEGNLDTIKSGQQLLQWTECYKYSRNSLPLVKNFFHKPEDQGGLSGDARTQKVKLEKTLNELKSDCRWLHALFCELSLKELDALDKNAAFRLLTCLPTCRDSNAKTEIQAAIKDLDLRSVYLPVCMCVCVCVCV